MNPAFDFDRLTVRLSELSPMAAFAVGLLALERALPGYYKFLSDTGLHDLDDLRRFSASAWRALEDKTVGSLPQPSRDEVFDTENYDSIFTTSAIDAASIAQELRYFSSSYEKMHIANCYSYRIDTIDIFIQNSGTISSSSLELDKFILTNELMQEELLFQNTDIEYMRTVSDNYHDIWSSSIKRAVDGQYSRLRLKI